MRFFFIIRVLFNGLLLYKGMHDGEGSACPGHDVKLHPELGKR